ncbi:MAG: FAD-dependent oxidoreductase [Pseudohongiellaceae bacterium]
MKIAIVGTGISGLAAAYRLYRHHDITVYEAADRIGGHTATIDVQLEGREYRIDTGFIVYNDWTYPQFIRLMDELGVGSRPSDMSFGVRDEDTGLEYAGVEGRKALFDALFAQRRRLFSPRHLGMLIDILRFNRLAVADVVQDRLPADLTLTEYVARKRLGRAFRDFYLAPMASAIWSTPLKDIVDFPVRFMLPFMYHHGLLSVSHRPTWRTLSGGSDAYIAPITAGFRDRIHLNTPVRQIRRFADHAIVRTDAGERYYDQVVLACHSDQALAILQDPCAAEQEILSAIRYRNNDVVLHTDIAVMPRSQRAWASWNYSLTADRAGPPRVTYDMNRLMGLDGPHRFLVSLNDTARIDPAQILGRFQYAHPVFTVEGARAQQRWSEINGRRCTWYCGAWWGKGFHEDGVASARHVTDALNLT